MLVSNVTALRLNSNPKISPYITETLAKQAKMKVDIYLEDPVLHKNLSPEQRNKVLDQIPSSKISKIYEEAVAAELTLEEINKLAQKPEVKRIEPYFLLEQILEEAVPLIDADLVWQLEYDDSTFTGENQAVCVVDSGVNFNHPDLAPKNIGGGNFDCTLGEDCPLNPDLTLTNGHGTHVAEIAAASGGIFGIGKGANIISMIVIPNGTTTSDVILIKRAINWCANHAEEYNISVITISIGSVNTYSYECDSLYTVMTNAINNAVANNIPVTIGTGNAGSSTGISFPSCVANALSVGATNKDDYLAPYSNYNQFVKVFAPGTYIHSTCLNGGYCYNTGTSMATPMVAGAIAILQQYVGLTGNLLTPSEMENLLFQTGDPILNLPDSWKRINIYNAVMTDLIDLDGDFLINGSDLAILLGDWGQCTDECEADFNGDGIVNADDLALLLGHWNSYSGDPLSVDLPQEEKEILNAFISKTEKDYQENLEIKN